MTFNKAENLKNRALIYWKPIFAIVMWGISFVATKIALRGLTPVTIVNMRLVLSVLLLAAIALITKQNFKIEPKKHLGILLLAVIAVVHILIQVTGLQYTSASNTG